MKSSCRRASLDVTGTLPTAEEVALFMADSSSDKRAKKIEELLKRPGYAAQWTTFLCDITGNNDDQLRNFLPQAIRPENQWYQWIYKRVADNAALRSNRRRHRDRQQSSAGRIVYASIARR